MCGEDHAVFVCGGYHRFKFFGTQTNGLFADNVYFVFKKFDADGLVHIVGNSDYRKFDLAAVQQFVHGRKRLDA